MSRHRQPVACSLMEIIHNQRNVDGTRLSIMPLDRSAIIPHNFRTKLFLLHPHIQP